MTAAHCPSSPAIVWKSGRKGREEEDLITGAGERRVMRRERGRAAAVGGEVEPFTRGKIQNSPIDACSQWEVKPV